MSSRALLRAAFGLLWIALFTAALLLSAHDLRADEPLYLPPATEPLPVQSSPIAPELTFPAPLDAGGDDSLAPPMRPGVRYWIVSSRGAPQQVTQMHCGQLDVCEQRCDGSLCPSSLANLQSQLLPGAPVLILMHGSYVSWRDNLVQSEGTYQWIRCACPDRPLNVIFYTWPSDRERCLLAGFELRRQGWEAETNAFYLASLLRYIPDCHPVCLLGHSYGARIALAAMHLAGGGDIQGCRLSGGIGAKRVRVVLAAAAVDHNWLNDGGRYGCALCRTECVLNLRHRHDLVLKLYPLLRPLTSHRALGASGVTFFDRRRQTCTCRIENFDVTGLVPNSHFWPDYYDTPQLAGAIAPWVYFPEVNPGYVAPLPLAQSTAPTRPMESPVTLESGEVSTAASPATSAPTTSANRTLTTAAASLHARPRSTDESMTRPVPTRSSAASSGTEGGFLSRLRSRLR